MSMALYASWPARARRTWGLAALAIVVGGYLISALPLVIGLAVFAAFQQARGADPLAVEAAMQASTLTVLMPLLLSQFLVWMAITLGWAWVFERRGMASLGLALTPAALVRYLAGLGLGVGLLLAIASMVMVLGGLENAPGALSEGAGATPDSLAAALARPGVVTALGFAALVFLVQGGAEEVVFRGWFMSTLAARWGVRAAVIVSSLAFMLFHVHVFISGIVFGLAALAGIGLMGMVFALLALFTRSVWEAVAAHGAFNAAAVTAPTLALLAGDRDLDVSAAFAQVFNSATGMAGADAVTLGPETFAQALAAGAIAAVLAVLVARAGRARRAWKAEDAAV
jgi:membrane protease YdiL (CAAX protease family)